MKSRMTETAALLALLYVAVLSCEKDGGPYSGRRDGKDAVLSPADSGSVEEIVRYDTTVYVSGVHVADGYDWRQDEAAGHYDAEIVLFRNGERILSVKAGDKWMTSPDPDTHHMIDGCLFTEYSSPTQTVIRKNGTEILRFDGREYLLGLLEHEGRTYTLSGRRDGSGFACRVDGTLLLNKSSGRVFGSFAEDSYGRTGALYVDEGKVCFCYSPSPARLSLVADGVETDIPLPPDTYVVEDARRGFGKIWAVCRTAKAMVLREGRSDRYLGAGWSEVDYAHLYALDDRFIVSGNRSDGEMTLVWWNSAYTETVNRPDCMLMPLDGVCEILHDCGADGLELMLRWGVLAGFEGKHYIFSPSCVESLGQKVWLLLNPAAEGKSCSLWCDGQEKVFEGMDYLSGVEVVVSQTRIRRVIRQALPLSVP